MALRAAQRMVDRLRAGTALAHKVKLP
jgi:hypothetical protein